MAQQILYGWFDDASQIEPTYEPPRDAPCPYCWQAIHEVNVRTTNLMYVGNVYAKRSYFYRSHRTCAEKAKGILSPVLGVTMDDYIFRVIELNGD